MNKKLIRLTESDLHRIVRESVNNVLNEVTYTTDYLNGIPNTDEDLCTLIFGRTFKAVGELNELIQEIDQQMPQSGKKRFGKVIKALQKSYDYMEKARLLTDRISNEIRFGSKKTYHRGGENERRMESNFGNI